MRAVTHLWLAKNLCFCMISAGGLAVELVLCLTSS